VLSKKVYINDQLTGEGAHAARDAFGTHATMFAQLAALIRTPFS